MIEASIRGAKISTKCTWTFLAGLRGSSALQRMAASGTEDKRREMGKMGKIPSWRLVNAKSGGIKSPKIQNHSPFHFFRIIYFLTSIRICSKQKRKKKDPKENLFFLATTKMTGAAIRRAKIYKKLRMHSSFQFLLIIYFVTSNCICSSRERQKNVENVKLFFLTTTKLFII